MLPKQRHPLDKNVPPNWRPPAGLADRKLGMMWTDRTWHWLVSLGGLCVIAVGVAFMAFFKDIAGADVHFGKFGGLIIGLGFAVFFLGFPSRTQRNGYRE